MAGATVVAALCVTGATASSAATAGGRASVIVPSPYLLVSADSMDALGLTYVGTVSVSTPSGDVQVLRFTMTGGSLAGVGLAQPCAGGAATTLAATSAALGATTLDVVSLQATVGGAPVEFTVAQPPVTGFPAEVQLQSVALSVTSLSATTLKTQTLHTATQRC